MFWRILQGAGGAALLSTAQATIRQIFPREQQGLVQAIFLLGIIVAPTLGPTLGGWITDNYTWNWCFFINVPIGIAATFLVTHLPQGSARQQRRHAGTVDWLGITLLTVGLGALQYVLEEGNSDDWFNERHRSCGSPIVAAVCLIGMLWWELTPRNQHPVVNFRVLQEPGARGLDLPLRGARLRALRRRLHLPALHPEPAALHADRDRAGAAAGRPRHRELRRSSAAGCSTGPGRWWTRAS